MNDQIRKLIIANRMAGRAYEENIRNLNFEEWLQYCAEENLYDNKDCIYFEEE